MSSPSRRHPPVPWAWVLLSLLLAGAGPRPSSFRPCPDKVAGGCDYGEACDYTTYDVRCPAGACDKPQTGDQRCHRVCDDGACGSGETCVPRPLLVSDTPSEDRPLCLCAGKDCPVRGPGGMAWPAEGDLTLWRPERAMPVDLYYHAATSSPARLFVSGGLRVQTVRRGSATLAPNRKVFSAAFQAGGGLGAWKESGTLPERLVHHGMVVAAGRLFVAGGEVQRGFTAAVRSAPLRKDGTLGPWRKEASMPGPRAWHSLVAQGDVLWVLGGSVDPSSFSDGTRELWHAKLSRDGRVTRWESVMAPESLHYDQGAAVSNGRLYTVDGRGRLSSIALGAGERWRTELSPPWKEHVDFGKSGQHLVRLVALPELLLVLMPRGLTLTAGLLEDGTLLDWQPASRLYNASSGFATATGPGGRAYVLGGTSGDPSMERNAEVWSTGPLAP
jgi:hypothetical protein